MKLSPELLSEWEKKVRRLLEGAPLPDPPREGPAWDTAETLAQAVLAGDFRAFLRWVRVVVDGWLALTRQPSGNQMIYSYLFGLVGTSWRPFRDHQLVLGLGTARTLLRTLRDVLEVAEGDEERARHGVHALILGTVGVLHAVLHRARVLDQALLQALQQGVSAITTTNKGGLFDGGGFFSAS